jgi:TolB-like protein
MASIIQGYNYDIFISYRQNDNKYDGWVTTFTNNLTLELEATIKDKLSIYFDINPHDGLLETHTVDKSLEDKLKCLIFIPIISRTYCDTSAFAWQNEFMAFNRLAKQDKFGRDIRVSRGNFASRILPIRIHELDTDDILLLENEMGGTLRSIDFVFKASGVNRPLRANEDHPQDNLNKTYYRDQINKVANAVEEIIDALKSESEFKERQKTEDIKDKPAPNIDHTKEKLREPSHSRGGRLILTGIVLLGLLSVIFRLIFPSGWNTKFGKESELEENRISITVMPFNNLTNDSTLNYLTIGVQDGIITTLSFYPEEFKVRPFEIIYTALREKSIKDFSALTPVTGSKISKRLEADFFLLGDIYKTGEIIRLNTQLVSSNKEEIVKSFQTEGVSERIMYVIDTLSKTIRDYLLVTKIQRESLNARPMNPYKSAFIATSPEAYRYHILAREALFKLDFVTASRMDSQAIAIDTNFIGAIVTLCWEYYYTGRYDEAAKWLQKAYSKRERLPLAQKIVLDYQYSTFFQTPDEQIKYLRQLQEIEDNNPSYYLLLGYLYISLSKYPEAITELEKAQVMYSKLGTEPHDLFYYHFLLTAYNKTGEHRKEKATLRKAERHFLSSTNKSNTGDNYYIMALIYSDVGMLEKAEENFRKGYSLNPGNQGIISNYAYSLIDNNLDVDKGLELINNELKEDSGNAILLDIKGWALYRQKKYGEALKLLEQAYAIIPSADIKSQIDSVKATSVQNR